MTTESAGVLYLAFGDRYKSEAMASIRTLRRASPGLPVAVITDEPWDESGADIVIRRERVLGLACKPTYLPLSPFSRTLFVDTDAVFASCVRNVFGLLDHFDVGVTFDGPQMGEPGGLECVPKPNAAVLLYRDGPNTRQFFESWLENYSSRADVIALSRTPQGANTRGMSVEQSLGIALAKTPVRAIHLGTALNFRLGEFSLTYSLPQIIVGPYRNLEIRGERLRATIARRWSGRVGRKSILWHPTVRAFLPNNIRHSDPLLAMALLFRRWLTEFRHRRLDGRAASRSPSRRDD